MYLRQLITWIKIPTRWFFACLLIAMGPLASGFPQGIQLAYVKGEDGRQRIPAKPVQWQAYNATVFISSKPWFGRSVYGSGTSVLAPGIVVTARHVVKNDKGKWHALRPYVQLSPSGNSKRIAIDKKRSLCFTALDICVLALKQKLPNVGSVGLPEAGLTMDRFTSATGRKLLGPIATAGFYREVAQQTLDDALTHDFSKRHAGQAKIKKVQQCFYRQALASQTEIDTDCDLRARGSGSGNINWLEGRAVITSVNVRVSYKKGTTQDGDPYHRARNSTVAVPITPQIYDAVMAINVPH